jgi:hypothetical protein
MPHVLDSESLEFMHTIRQRSAYRDALAEIKVILAIPHIAAYPDALWDMVNQVIVDLESKGKQS